MPANRDGRDAERQGNLFDGFTLEFVEHDDCSSASIKLAQRPLDRHPRNVRRFRITWCCIRWMGGRMPHADDRPAASVPRQIDEGSN